MVIIFHLPLPLAVSVEGRVILSIEMAIICEEDQKKNDYTPDNKSLIMNIAILDAVLLLKCCNFVFYICVKKLNLPNNNIRRRFNNKLITI